jgi:hypothetical protein
VSFAAITLCVASQRVFIVVDVYFVMDSVRKFLDTPLFVVEIEFGPKLKNLNYHYLNMSIRIFLGMLQKRRACEELFATIFRHLVRKPYFICMFLTSVRNMAKFKIRFL